MAHSQNSQYIGTDLTGQLDGLHAPHYTNGRLLTAEDLQADQQAVLAREGWLGKASGYGVIEGLLVTSAGLTSVKISAGLGLNRQGVVLSLASDLTLPLIPQVAASQTPPDAGRFVPCDFQSTGAAGSTPAGAYLLTVQPASHFAGLAPVKAAAGSTSNGSGGAGCGSKWEVEGIQFKIIHLVGFEAQVSGITDNKRRNLLAHWCSGSEHLPDLPLDPFHFASMFGGLDQLDPADFTPCDLPLAVFYWTGTALAFVDLWSARRRLIRPDPLDETQESPSPGLIFRFPFLEQAPWHLATMAGPLGAQAMTMPQRPGTASWLSQIFFHSGGGFFGTTPPARVTQAKLRTWKGLIGDKRVADAQARFLQYQEQIQGFMQDGTASQIVAGDYFRFLPPVSFLPITLAPLARLLGSFEGPRRNEMVGRSPGLEAEMPWIYTLVAESQAAAPGDASPTATETAAAPLQLSVSFSAYLEYLLLKREFLAKTLQDQGLGNLVNTGTAGFNIEVFFLGFQSASLNASLGLVDGETVDFRLQQSWYDEALDLDSILHPPEELNQFLRPYLELYLVAENLASAYDQPYMMIIKGHRPTVWRNLSAKIR